MSFRHFTRWVALTVTMTACLVGPGAVNLATAQNPKTEPGKKGDKNAKPDGTAPGVSMEIAKVEGKYDAFAQGIIKILDSANQEVFLHSQNDTVVHYTAEAEPAWLMPGYMVRFSASFDQSGKPSAALKSIEVFTPSIRRRLSPEQMREQTPGVHKEDKGQPEGAKDLFADKTKKPQPQPKGRSAKKDVVVPGQTFRVVGQLMNVQSNMLTVNAGTPIQIEIDPAATVSVTADDLNSIGQMISKGDGVNVSGLRNPAQPNHIYCESIQIKATKKLTQAIPQPKKGKGSARDKDDAKGAKDAKSSKDGKDGKDVPKKTNPADKKPQ